MQTYTLNEAAELCGVSVKALRRRAERGTLQVVVREGVRRVPESELRRLELLPEEQVQTLRQELARLERELTNARQLTEHVERQAQAETQAREHAEQALLQARAAETQARQELHQLAQLNWRERRKRLRQLRAATPLGAPLPRAGQEA